MDYKKFLQAVTSYIRGDNHVYEVMNEALKELRETPYERYEKEENKRQQQKRDAAIYRDDTKGIIVNSITIILYGVHGKSDKGFPYVNAEIQSYNKGDEALLKEGWVAEYYERNMGYYGYIKEADIRNLIKDVYINFTKKTDEREKTEFAYFDSIMDGAYGYPIKCFSGKALEQIIREAYKNCEMKSCNAIEITDRKLQNKLLSLFMKNLINNEYNSLLQLKRDINSDLTSAVDDNLSLKDQKDIIMKVYDEALKKHKRVADYRSERARAVAYHERREYFDKYVETYYEKLSELEQQEKKQKEADRLTALFNNPSISYTKEEKLIIIILSKNPEGLTVVEIFHILPKVINPQNLKKGFEHLLEIGKIERDSNGVCRLII